MNYTYSITVRDNDILRSSFNQLTRKTFCFDFTSWYEAGHWGDLYIPHVLLHDQKVVSNVSVNLMQFDVQGVRKNYIQLGTVMTDEAYRGQGCNREIMERILQEYAGKADGIYLFGNDSVVNYYPKFGFQPSKEYEYYTPCRNTDNTEAYEIQKLNPANPEQYKKLYDAISSYSIDSENSNQNDAMYMSHNLGLYQFWIGAEYENHIFYLPEVDSYAVAALEGDVLQIHQIFGKQQVDIPRLAKSFGKNAKEAVLGYTPVQKTRFLMREHKEEDCTLFILGDDLQRIEKEKMMFPLLSHA